MEIAKCTQRYDSEEPSLWERWLELKDKEVQEKKENDESK